MAAWSGARWMLAAMASGAAALAGMVLMDERRRRAAPAGAAQASARGNDMPDRADSRGTSASAPTAGAASTGAQADGARAGGPDLEGQVVTALRRDEVAGSAAVDVAALADDMIELSGRVDTRAQADRAVDAAQSVTGVRTVVNRLEVREEDERAAQVRERREAGDPALQERGAYGMGVGMGRRRQSAETDPDRPDDSSQRRARELAAAEVARQELGGGTTPAVDGAARPDATGDTTGA